VVIAKRCLVRLKPQSCLSNPLTQIDSHSFPHMLESLYIPTKRRYHCNDPFFSEGDIAIRAAWLQKQDSQLEEYWDSVQEEAIDTQRYVLQLI
jgi:hypothetical protein